MSQEKPKAQEILRVVRNPQTGEQAIQVAGRYFQSIDDIKHPKAREIILSAIGKLVEAAGGYEALVQAGVVPEIEMPEPPAPPEPTPIEEPTPVPSTTDEMSTGLSDETAVEDPTSPKEDKAQARFLSSLRSSTASVEESEESSAPSFWGGLRRGRQKPTPVEPLPMLNIGQQINSIVQQKLATESQLQGRHIHISNDEFGGIEINIDGRKHDDVAQVEDPLVRMLIKLAIKEWEEGRG